MSSEHWGLRIQIVSVLERKTRLDPGAGFRSTHAEESEGINGRGDGFSLIPHRIKRLSIR